MSSTGEEASRDRETPVGGGEAATPAPGRAAGGGEAATPVPGRAAEGGSRRVVLGTLGAALEWFDFTLYVYLAPVISQLFFPSDNPLNSLLATFGVFAAGYVMRPLGAAYLGNYGDTRGRKAALTLSVSLMTAAMLAIALLPTEGSIGVAAPALLVALRLVQGFSLGGEFSGSIVLLQESAAPERRAFVTNLVQISTGAGVLLSAGSATVMHSLLSDSQVDEFGWRLLFLLGTAIGIVALVMLRRLADSAAFEQARKSDREEAPLREVIHTELRPLITNFLLNGYQALIYYVVITFVPTFLTSILGGEPEESLVAATVGAFAFAVLCPPAGAWSDRVGRKPLLAGAAIGLALAAWPLFELLSVESLPAVIVAQLLLVALVVIFTAPALATATELFTTRTRYTGVAIGYNLGAAVFGGTAPLLATALIKLTGYDQAAALLLVAASLLILIVVAQTPETYRKRLR